MNDCVWISAGGIFLFKPPVLPLGRREALASCRAFYAILMQIKAGCNCNLKHERRRSRLLGVTV